MQIGQSCTHPIGGLVSLDLRDYVDGRHDVPHLIGRGVACLTMFKIKYKAGAGPGQKAGSTPTETASPSTATPVRWLCLFMAFLSAGDAISPEATAELQSTTRWHCRKEAMWNCRGRAGPYQWQSGWCPQGSNR